MDSEWVIPSSLVSLVVITRWPGTRRSIEMHPCSQADQSGIVPGVGDAVNATLNYFLIVKPTKKLDVPKNLIAKMMANNAVSFGLG